MERLFLPSFMYRKYKLNHHDLFFLSAVSMTCGLVCDRPIRIHFILSRINFGINFLKGILTDMH